MPRPLSRAQALQNRAFLAALRRTGNAREAARELCVHRATFTKRRAKHPAFAADWDAALTIAHATLNNPSLQRKGDRRPNAGGGGASPGRTTPADCAGQTPPEPHVSRTASGRLQLRRTQPGGLTRAGEQVFLAALSATANVRLSAAAAGFSHATFYARRRTSPGFAREMRLALAMGYDRLELALLETGLVESHVDDAWRHNQPPPMPAMTPNQALQLLYLHQKEARLLAEPAHFKRRRGESDEAMSYRYQVMYRHGQDRRREEYALAEAARRDRGEPSPFEPAPPVLPALDQVTGWSKADPCKAAHHPGVAMFGGWRLPDWEVK
jgi:hypothetical protein